MTDRLANLSHETWDALQTIGDSAAQTIRFSEHQIALSSFQLNSRPWTAAEDALLGTDTDREIGRRIHRSTVAIWNRRKKLGIRIVLQRSKVS
jgi:hypothetical protein